MEESIIKKYQEGWSISKLLKEYPSFNRDKINKLLKANGITIRGGRKKKNFSPEQVEHIKKMIENGSFIKEIADFYKIDRKTMRLRLEDLGLSIENYNRVNRHIKSDFFSVIDSPIKAYWLGFLYTDGSVDKGKSRGRIRLQLQEKDLEILEKFREDLNIESKIIYDKRKNSKCCSVEFTDEQIYNDLAKYDIIPQKTYKISNIPYKKIPKEYLKDFVLGLYDGDGGISYSENCSTDVTISYTAYHESEVEDFQFLINSLVGLERKNKNIFRGAWATQWRGRLQCLKILEVLYKDAPRFLKRKYDKFLVLKNSLK